MSDKTASSIKAEKAARQALELKQEGAELSPARPYDLTYAHLRLGIDVGSTTVKLAVIDDNDNLIYANYERHHTDVRATAKELFIRAQRVIGDAPMRVSITGSGGMLLAKWLGLEFVQEVIASKRAVETLIPQTDCAIELGGEDAKILFLTNGTEVRMNGSCAGGTGAFIDQMATLLKMSADEMNKAAEQAQRTYTIASRCGVFAKSDVQPLINQGARTEDIAASIYKAVVNQTIAGLAQGREIEGNIVYLGGPLTFFSELRKAFDHDRLSYNRCTDREYQEVSRSYLSVLLSGTPAQVKPLIPTAENGLFSRQNFYYMPRVTQWADQFGEDEVDVDEEFRLMGNEWKNTLDERTLRGLFTLKLTHAQHKQFNFLFDKLFHRSGKINGDEMSSSVIRLAVNACRMMSIVAILRSLEDPSLVKPDAHISSDNLKDRIIPRWNLAITDDDFHAVLALVEPLYLHATHVLSFLSSSVIKRRSTADKDMLFAEMEDEFTRRMLLEKAHDRRIPESTALTWLKRLTKQGALVSVDGKGTYHKN